MTGPGRGVRNTVLLSLLFVVMVLAAFYVSTQREHLLTEEQLRDQGTFVLPKPRELARFTLQTHTGEPFTVEDLEGRWTFLFFGFSHCPDICPVALSVLAQVERNLKEQGYEDLANEFRAVLVTVDPERDDPATLSRYVQAFSDRFIGVTGTPQEIAELATQVNVAFMKVPLENGDYTVDHTANIVVINPRGHYHGFIRQPHDAEKILLAYRSLDASL